MQKPEVIIIGAGPGGLAAAHSLASSGQVDITLVQREGVVTFLPGITPVLLGLRQAAQYRHPVTLPQVRILSGEVTQIEPGRITFADGTSRTAAAVIAAPGLSTGSASFPAGPRSFPIWELAEAVQAQQAISALVSGRVVVSVASLPYRCPPAPYGLAISLKALYAERKQPVDVVVTTPEERPLQPLGDRVGDFIESLVGAGQVKLETAFQIDMEGSRDGTLVAKDGRSISYDLGLFVPSHQCTTLLKDFPRTGPLVQVDAQHRTAMERTWVIGDAAATLQPRSGGSAEGQGRTAAASVLAALGLAEEQPPSLPTPFCYVWTGNSHAARIRMTFPRGLPPVGKPDISLEAPQTALFAEALNASAEWLKQIE